MTIPTDDSERITTIVQRFAALALSEGLTKKSTEYKARRRAFIVDEVHIGFAAVFGGNTSSLVAWKDLLRTVGIEGAEALASIKQCKAALKGKFVNIVDLVDAASAGSVMKRGVFDSEQALARYIRRTKKSYPCSKAKTNQLLRQFLIKVGK
ncbi:hypothetical protein DXG03_005553 [Asterophora parasitica]|uniref:Uncharacterized protein n=1 Tax=Asterophora parasitica TaxID=117018 RepID=A0A9P7FZT4_9AGAR|nr:hypothetical protein DXG03_005553 [Asterophora parasitica]